MEMFSRQPVYNSQNNIFYKVRNEKTASFAINTEKNFWYDFGSGEGGDVIALVQKLDKCTFQEALKKLNN